MIRNRTGRSNKTEQEANENGPTTRRPVRSHHQASPSPAQHRPGARFARRERRFPGSADRRRILMTVFCSSRRIALVLALALLGLAWPVSAVQAGAFRASGTQVLTDSKANTFGGTLSGRAMSGGSFTGTFS